MPSTFVAGFLLASLSSALTLPHNGHAIKVNQVPAGKRPKNGLLEMVKTYRKYGKQPPQALVQAADDCEGIVAADPDTYALIEYTSPVTVGNDMLTMDFDTGSSDFWVFSTLQPSSQTSGHSLYNPNTGTLESGESWGIGYGDGSSAAGVVYSDRVIHGGVTATSQAVEAATSASAGFVDDHANDGLLGLGFQPANTCSPNKCTTWFNSVQYTLASTLFTADLKHKAAGSYTFGYIDDSLYTGSITYVPVNTSSNFWGFQAGGYSVGSSLSPLGTVGSAIADTGTSFLLLPTPVPANYYSKVPGATYSSEYGYWFYPCSETLPNFNVEIGGAVFTVPGSWLPQGPGPNSGQCFAGLQPSFLDFAVFGDVFLWSVYAIFEPAVPQIGFAKQS